MRSTALKSFAFGFALFGATEAGWFLLQRTDPSGSRWVLEPNPGIVTALITHFVGALLFSFLLRPNAEGRLAFAAGIAGALVVALFLVGPGNLWPIVIVIDAVFLTPALVGGFVAEQLLSRWSRPAP